MNLGRFLRENPDTLGCLTQNTSGSIERLFPPLYLFCENETKIQTLQNMNCSLFLLVCLDWSGGGVGGGGGWVGVACRARDRQILSDPKSLSVYIDFVFNKYQPDHIACSFIDFSLSDNLGCHRQLINYSTEINGYNHWKEMVSLCGDWEAVWQSYFISKAWIKNGTQPPHVLQKTCISKKSMVWFSLGVIQHSTHGIQCGLPITVKKINKSNLFWFVTCGGYSFYCINL